MKILILNGDDLEQKIEVKDRFVFFITKKKVYHIDSADGEMYEASHTGFKHLGKAHKKLVKKEMK